MNRIVISTLVIAVLAGCSSAGPTATASQATTPTARASSSAQVNFYPTEVFAGLSDDPVSDELAAELQAVLDTSADDHGLTAAVISPRGTWNGATGLAAGDRAMVPNDKMSIANIGALPGDAEPVRSALPLVDPRPPPERFPRLADGGRTPRDQRGRHAP